MANYNEDHFDESKAYDGESREIPEEAEPKEAFGLVWKRSGKGSFKPVGELELRERPQGVTDDPSPSNLSTYRCYEPILSPGEEADLIRDAQAGNPAATDTLLRRYHREILKIVSGYSGLHEDMMAAGTEGLLEAILKFDLRRNNSLSAFARHRIRRRVSECVRNWRKLAGETRVDKWVRANAPRWPFKPPDEDGKLRERWPYKRNALQLTAADVLEVLQDPKILGRRCSRAEAELAMQRLEVEAFPAQVIDESEDSISDGRWAIPSDRPVVECDPSGGEVTDADWSKIVAGRARPSGLPGRGRNPLPPEPLRPISRERYEEDQRQVYRCDEAKAAQYNLGFNWVRHGGIDPKRDKDFTRLVWNDTNPFRNGRHLGCLDYVAAADDQRAIRRLKQVGRVQYASRFVDDRKDRDAYAGIYRGLRRDLYPWAKPNNKKPNELAKRKQQRVLAEQELRAAVERAKQIDREMNLELRVIEGLKDANTITIVRYRGGPLFVAHSEPLHRSLGGWRKAV